MALDLAHWMIDEVVLRKKEGEDGRNRPVFGAARTIKCRVQPFFETIRGPDGQERRCTAKIATHETINPEDWVWNTHDGVDADDLSQGIAPLRTQRATNPTGARLAQIFL